MLFDVPQQVIPFVSYADYMPTGYSKDLGIWFGHGILNSNLAGVWIQELQIKIEIQI